VARRPEYLEGKIERRLTITEGDALELYCNATGFNSVWHQLSWLKGIVVIDKSKYSVWK